MWHNWSSTDFRQQMNVVTNSIYFTARVQDEADDFFTIIGREDSNNSCFILVLEESGNLIWTGTILAMSGSKLYLIKDEVVILEINVCAVNILEN